VLRKRGESENETERDVSVCGNVNVRSKSHKGMFWGMIRGSRVTRNDPPSRGTPLRRGRHRGGGKKPWWKSGMASAAVHSDLDSNTAKARKPRLT